MATTMMALLTPDFVARLKVVIAVVTCLLLYFEAKRRLELATRWKVLVATALAVLAIGCHFDFFRNRSARFYHRWEMFHYVMGAKYAPELGYERLYWCTAVADAESGHREAVVRRPMRDLRDDSLMPSASALEQAEQCTNHFSAERWRSFTHDVEWFRRTAGGGKWWDEMQRDHGYNPSPVWTLLGHALASLGPVSHGLCTALASLDLFLMVSTIAVLVWGFGWRVGFVATVFWGIQAPAAFFWTGGSFLRQDWLFLLTSSAALMRRGYFFWAGASLCYASLLRVFPALFWSGPGLVVAASLVRRRRLLSEHRRLLLGGLCAAALLLPAGALVGGARAYGEFWSHISMHAASPISNHMSLRTLFSAVPDARLARQAEGQELEHLGSWGEARVQRFAKLEWLYVATAGVLLALFVHAVVGLRTLWLALGLSVLPIVVLTDPSCYYYSMWIVPVVLTRARRSLEMVLVALGGVGQVLALRLAWVDDRYLALAALYVACAVAFVLLFARWRRRPARSRPLARPEGSTD